MKRVLQFLTFLSVVFLLMSGGGIFAGEIKFRHLTVDDGLPSNVVNVVFQSRTGFIWVGTKEGLARFDGHRMVRIPMPENEYDLVSKRRINALCEDDEYNLWMGTTYGVLCYNQVTETFKHYLFDEENRLDLSRFVNSIVIGKDGVLWAGTRNGIFYLDKERDQFVVYPYFFHHNEFRSITKGERIVRVLFFDRLGYLWVGTEGNGANRLNLSDHTKNVFLNDPLNPNTLCSNFVETIFEDSFGILWFGTTNGLARYDRENESFQCILKGEGEAGLSDDIVTSIMEDGMGNLYTGTRNGLDFFQRREKKIIHYFHHPDNQQSISSNNINCCFRDRTGAYWIGSMQGINSFNYRTHRFELHQSVPDDKNSLINNTLRTLVTDKKQNIWIGTQNNGIDRFERSSGKFFHYSLDDPGKNRIYTSFLSRSGELFFGTGEGILKYHPAVDRFKLFDFDGKHSYTNKGIYEIVEDKEGNLYFSEMDRGLFRYNIREKTLEEISLHLKDIDPSKARNIKVMHFDQSGNLWFSLQMAGVARYNPKTGHIVHWGQGMNGLQSNQVWDIFENEQGIWLGTENGLHLYHRSSDLFTNYNVQQGLPGSIVVSILEDDAHRLWLGTNKGLSCFDHGKGTFVNYSGSDGLQGDIFEYKVKQKTGNSLLFGGNNGLNIFNPDEFASNTYVPVPRFTNLNISKHAVSPNQEVGSNVPLKRSVILVDRIELKDSYRDIEIEFSAFSYIDSRKNSYKYHFSGEKDTVWLFTEENKNSLYFPRLKPGNYLLQVKAANCDGIWSREPVALKIRVTRDLRKIAGYISNFFLVLIIAGMLFYFRKSLKKVLLELKRKSRQAERSDLLLPRFKLDPNLDPRIKKDLQRLIDCMEKEHMYLDKRLTKIQLAAHLKISLANLSSLLREQLDIGFNDFVNYFRVEAVKKMLNDPKNKDFTLLSIAEDCGFNSKTSFYRIFKNFIGLTPAEYLEKHITKNVKSL